MRLTTRIALTKVAWADDDQVVLIVATKEFGPDVGTFITVTPIGVAFAGETP